MKNSFKILAGKSEGKRSRGSPRHIYIYRSIILEWILGKQNEFESESDPNPESELLCTCSQSVSPSWHHDQISAVGRQLLDDVMMRLP
jgi:hypothetical protein